MDEFDEFAFFQTLWRLFQFTANIDGRHFPGVFDFLETTRSLERDRNIRLRLFTSSMKREIRQ